MNKKLDQFEVLRKISNSPKVSQRKMANYPWLFTHGQAKFIEVMQISKMHLFGKNGQTKTM